MTQDRRRPPGTSTPRDLSRRRFLRGASGLGAISVLEWLGLFQREGVPGTPGQWSMAHARAAEETGSGGENEVRFLVYWFLEGGWDSYALFSPVDSPNHSSLVIPEGELYPSPGWSDQLYRVKGYGSSSYPPPSSIGKLRLGYLGQGGAELAPDLCVISSHYGNTFHSGGRFDYHYGRYSRNLSEPRQPDERSVIQAFCEARGAAFLMPHISWHRWLSDGELALSNYPEGTGYYEKLGPAYAHTIYGKTPEYFRQRLMAIGDVATAQRRALIRGYTDNLHDNFIRGREGASVQAFSSALEIYRSLTNGELTVDPQTLFTDPALRASFGIQSGDEATSERSVNGNPARSKETPHVRMQALMAYECMRAKLGCGFWIESRDVRAFDSHRSRRTVLDQDSNADQKALIQSDLWDPLKALVAQLKGTEMPDMPGRSMWQQTTLVLCSEMGRSIRGEVEPILEGSGSDSDKWTQIQEQDVCQHWAVNGAAFLGGSVQGNRQFGRVGSLSLDAIPILPSGSLDPAFDPETGLLLEGRSPDPSAFIPDAGHLYSTALALAGVDPTGKGRNTRGPLSFVGSTL